MRRSSRVREKDHHQSKTPPLCYTLRQFHPPPSPCLQNLHLPLDVVLEQVLVHRVKVVAAHVVVVVGDCVGELLAIRSIFHIVRLVAVVVVKVAFGRRKMTLNQSGQKRFQAKGFSKNVCTMLSFLCLYVINVLLPSLCRDSSDESCHITPIFYIT